MKNNKGFASTFILFGLLSLFLVVMSILLFTMNNSSVLNSGLKGKLINNIEQNADREFNKYIITAVLGDNESWDQTTEWELSEENNTLTKYVSVGGSYGTLPVPYKKNYKFLGWYIKDGDNIVPVTSDTIVEENSSYYTLYSQFSTSKVICKRATTLHTEKCFATEKNCYGHGYYASGSQHTDVITYGRLGSTTLTPGDAFDCDVNNDGEYNSQTERFYYVSNKYVSGAYNSATFDNNYATLIYYTHYKNGAPSLDGANSGTAYYTTQSNTAGPVTAKDALPNTTDWSNLRSISTRNITDSSGTIKMKNFNYGSKAARLITLAEVYSACGQSTQLLQNEGFPASCNFMLENTRYSTRKVTEGSNTVYYTSDGKTRDTFGPWLETAYASNEKSVHRIDGYERNVASTSSDKTYYGVRPVIDVKLDNIDYK